MKKQANTFFSIKYRNILVSKRLTDMTGIFLKQKGTY